MTQPGSPGVEESSKRFEEQQPVKGPGPRVRNQKAVNELTRDERVEIMETQKVLSGRSHLFEPPPPPYLHKPEVRELFYNMELLEDGGITTTVKDISIHLDEVTLEIILGVPVNGIRSIEGCKPSEGFTVQATKRREVKLAGLPKKLLNSECQLLFEFINKILVPRSEKRTIASAADLFLMEQLSELEPINLLAIMMEHMHRAFTKSTLQEYECVEGPVKGRSQVAAFELQKVISGRPGTRNGSTEELQTLRDENA
ncbi:hypothetical protein KY284_036286 [Solanum tuberosum]|nr:hypothetical protein KY284_036286 [Solanum tuberosum]